MTSQYFTLSRSNNERVSVNSCIAYCLLKQDKYVRMQQNAAIMTLVHARIMIAVSAKHIQEGFQDRNCTEVQKRNLKQLLSERYYKGEFNSYKVFD